MSLYSEDIRKIDAQAEKILQRAENRVLVVNNYTYEYVAGLRNKSASNVQGNISVIIINEHILGFYQSVTSTFSVDLIEVHIPMRSALVSEKKFQQSFALITYISLLIATHKYGKDDKIHLLQI